jgi:DNA (cytosine-5)-methyltransferase 1
MTRRCSRSRREREASPLAVVPASAVTPGPGRRAHPDAGSGPVVGSLCTGYGGLDLGVLAALGGGRIAWVADPDPHIAQILDARSPGIPNLGDLRHIDWTAVEPVDVLAAGFPCQDISAAGKRAGIEKGVRSGLWADIVAGVRLLRPALVVVENVAGLRWRNGGLHRVLGDLAEAGYDALWRSVRAADVGAAHRRERVFLLAWLREPRADRRGGDVADADRARRLLQRHQRRQQAGWPIIAGPAAAVADADGLGREELHAPDADRWPVAARCGPVVADSASDGRDEGLPGATWVQGRPDAALSGHPPAYAAGAQPGRRQRDRRHLVAVPGADVETRSASGVEAAPVNWGVYEAAIRRWGAVLGRPAPHPTQPGNHGRPVLAPAFVEHLMGLSEGWVTDLPLPRTAQLRALGNGVVPQQAAYAVALLLDDLADLLNINIDTNHRSPTGQEVTAA